MSEFNIEVQGGSSVRLPTAGKYCDRDIIVTASGGGGKEEQEKSVTITENGTTEILPDEGKTLSKVAVNVAIESGGGEDTLRALLTKTLTELVIYDAVSLAGFRVPSESLKLIKWTTPNITTIDDYSFYGALRLEYADIGRITKLNTIILNGKHRIKAVVLRNTETVVSLNGLITNANSINKDDYYVDGNHHYCYFYVPKALIEDYKVATNWSNYANRFRAIEDYPEITGGVL